MKKKLYALFGMFFPSFKPQPETKPLGVIPPDPESSQHYTGSQYKGNYVWSGAMNLCWTELCQSLIHAPIALRTEDLDALRMTNNLNHPVCAKADLDAPSYYVKAGLGPQTVATINRECRVKFPEKSFPDLRIDLGQTDLISYAYFYKKVAYELPFIQKDVSFEGQKVAGFEAGDHQKHTVEILGYESDDRFILRLRLKNEGDELLLAKGFDTQTPGEMLKVLEAWSGHRTTSLGEEDYFKMPVLALQYRRDYPEMMGKYLDNDGFKECFIGQMFENIAFELDETGVRAESQAVISIERGSFAHPPQRRYFYLDKPFWVILKRKESPNPYFLLGVNNTKIMQIR